MGICFCLHLMSRIKITSFGSFLVQTKWGNTLTHHHHNPLQTMVPAVTSEMQCENTKLESLPHWKAQTLGAGWAEHFFLMDVQQNLDSENTLYHIWVLKWRFNFSIAVPFIIYNATQNTDEEDLIAFPHVRRMQRQECKDKLNWRGDFIFINLISFFCNAIQPTVQYKIC